MEIKKYIYIQYKDVLIVKYDFPKNYKDLLDLIKKEYNIEKDQEYMIIKIYYKNNDIKINIENEKDYEIFKNNLINVIHLELGFENINKDLDLNYNNNYNNDNNLNEDKFQLSDNLRKYIDEYLDEKIKIMKINIFQEFIEKQFSVNLINNNIIHYDINCSNCKQLIEGIRYKCSVCDNYNLCSKCEESNEHEHDFFKIQKNEDKKKEKEVNEMVKKLKKENKINENFDDYSIIKAIIENKYNKSLTKKYLLKKLENKNKDENK